MRRRTWRANMFGETDKWAFANCKVDRCNRPLFWTSGYCRRHDPKGRVTSGEQTCR